MHESNRSKRKSAEIIAIGLILLGTCSQVFAKPAEQEPSDLTLELRSGTGSNRFQLGEVIPLEVLISSSTPKRCLEPCKIFWESCFGYPQCRFETNWSFNVIPGTGWTDIGWHGCMSMSGPTVEVKSSDLTTEPKKYPYTLTNRFRFDTPGKYTVQLSITVGLDDETNPSGTDRLDHENAGSPPQPPPKHNFVSKTAEIVLEIVPAGDEWKNTVIEHGVAAWMASPVPINGPGSQEESTGHQEKEALCSLGTPEAALALVGLLSRGIDVRHCLRINSNKEVARREMRRLLVQPDIGVCPVFFSEYAKLRSPSPQNSKEIVAVPPAVVNEVRETLFASLSAKSPEAMILSLETVLRNPMLGYWVIPGSVYDLHEPYSAAVIAMAAVNFDSLSAESQRALLDTEWDHVRSPLMLPLVRRKAEAGNGHALLHWLELEPVATTAFIRQEIIRSVPRFSSFYLRLPDQSLPVQEQQIAANFVALNKAEELVREATLLHRYATRAVLSTVLPFIDQHLTEWPCGLQIPVLAYLLKVSPADARPRLEQVLRNVSLPNCPQGEFFPSLGYVEASPVLDSLAAGQVKDGTPLAVDAVGYLAKYGSPAMKPVMWEQLSRWHKKYVESGAELRTKSQGLAEDDLQLYNLDSRLREAYINAQGWTLSPEDVGKLSKLIGDEKTNGLACSFGCGSQLYVGPAPGNYYIYGRYNEAVFPPESRIDYLMPREQFHYSVNQYRCADLKSLEQKLLQFPAGSLFRVAHTGSPLDGNGDWAEIGAFLESHGYSFSDKR